MSDLLNGLSSYTDTYNSTKTDKMNNTLSSNFSTATDEELMDACKEFEAYFVEQMFKAMDKMVPKDDESSSALSSSSLYTDNFKDMLYEKYAGSATQRGEGLGIAKQLYEQMKRNYNLE